MSSEVVYHCDRCGKPCTGVASFDFGKDYAAGRNEIGQYPRIAGDLCSSCVAYFKSWFSRPRQRKPR